MTYKDENQIVLKLNDMNNKRKIKLYYKAKRSNSQIY